MNLFPLSTLGLCLVASTCLVAHGAEVRDWHQSALKSNTPDDEVLYHDIDGDGKPDIIERWWNGKRVRWLSESGNLRVGDRRGDQINDILQVDMDGDGRYDGDYDLNIKWCDTNGDGIADVQAIAVNPGKLKGEWSLDKQDGHPVWMVFINHDKHGVLGWMNWEKFDFACWAYTGSCNWLPNYHGNNDFVKTHAPAHLLADPHFNWENPFSFYDETGDGVSKMAMRWCAPVPTKNGRVENAPTVDSAFITYDLDGNSGKGNETSYDMTLHGEGGRIDVSTMVHPLPNFKGNPKFDPCFYHNEWRQLDHLTYMDRNKGPDLFFNTKWKRYYLTFDEDDDDHRWERVEMIYPTTNYRPDGPPVDIYSTARFNNKEGKKPGLCGAFQSDTLGDRGEFDLDGSGGGKLYVGPFDRKLHLLGAEWGAWTVDKNAEFHGGAGEPSKKPAATKVDEVVKYTDTDSDGFIDTIEYDYNGDGVIDLKVCLLDYKTDGYDPQKTEVIEPGKLGWKGMHELFNKMAQDAWVEALTVYSAAWKQDLTTPEIDKLAAASSMMQRYQNAYWIKEKVFRQIRDRANKRIEEHPEETAQWQKFLSDYIRAYYTGRFDELTVLIGQTPVEKR